MVLDKKNDKDVKSMSLSNKTISRKIDERSQDNEK